MSNIGAVAGVFALALTSLGCAGSAPLPFGRDANPSFRDTGSPYDTHGWRPSDGVKKWDLHPADEALADSVPKKTDLGPAGKVDLGPTGKVDTDKDSIIDAKDNCPKKKNTNQADLDKDGVGDVCDTDKDGDSLLNTIDPYPNIKNSFVYNKDPGPNGTDYERTSGWKQLSAKACTLDEFGNFLWMRLHTTVRSPAPFPNAQLVQARVSLKQEGAYSSVSWPSIGVIARSKNGPTFSAYVCIIAPVQNELQLFVAHSVSSFERIATTPLNAANSTTPWTLRLTAAQDDRLTCSIIVGGKSAVTASATPTTHLTGTAGIFSNRAEVCFDQLIVTNIP